MQTRICSRCERKRQLRFFTGPRGRVCVTCKHKARKATARRRHVKVTYGLTANEYEALLAMQKGKCAICHGTRPYSLAVDHDHKREREVGTRRSVRGLLCRRCNTLLARVSDSPALLRSAAFYLDNPPARGVIA